MEGYSVIELSRLLNHTSCNRLYDVMREVGIIPTLTKGRRPNYVIPAALVTALSKCKLGYSQWCNSHDLDPQSVADFLSKQEDFSDNDSRLAHWAFKNDFSSLYAKVYNTPAPSTPFRDPEKIAERNSSYTAVIQYDAERRTFVATIPEMPDFRSEGKTRDKAYSELKKHYVLWTSVNKLKFLPPKI